MLEENASASGTSEDGGDVPTPVGLIVGGVRTVAARSVDDTVQTEVALTCSATYQDVLTGKRRTVYGDRAATEYPDRAQFMLQSELTDERATVTHSFLDAFARANELPSNSVVVYAIPSFDNRATMLDTIVEESIGERLLCGYPMALCGSIPVFESGLDALDRIFIAINAGSTNLEGCVYRRGEQLARFSTGSVRGFEVDKWIINNVEERTQGRVHIDRTTAREYKEGRTDHDDFRPFTDSATSTGKPIHESTVEHGVSDAIDRYVEKAVDEIANGFLPRLASRSIKIYKRTLEKPIVLTGDMAVVPGLGEAFEDRLSTELQRNIVVIAPEEPTTAAARGAHRIARRLVETKEY